MCVGYNKNDRIKLFDQNIRIYLVIFKLSKMYVFYY